MLNDLYRRTIRWRAWRWCRAPWKRAARLLAGFGAEELDRLEASVKVPRQEARAFTHQRKRVAAPPSFNPAGT